MWQITYPPANGASLGSNLVKNVLFVKKGEYFCGLAPYENDIATLVTDRQTDKFFDTVYGCVCGFFLHLKFATSLLALLHLQNSYKKSVLNARRDCVTISFRC